MNYQIQKYGPSSPIHLLNRSVAIGMVACCLVLTGCDRPQTSSSNSAASEKAAATSGESAATAGTPGTAAVDPTRKETKWIGNIPYDVFYDDPLAIAADATKVAPSGPSVAESTTTPATTTSSGPTSNPATSPAEVMPAPVATTGTNSSAQGPDWGTIIPMDVLVEEIKVLRTRMTSNLQTVATFNKSVPGIANDGTMLSAMAAIAEVHPAEVNWKDKSKFVRDLGYEIYSKAEGTGRTPFNACKEPFDKITGILDGGPAPEGESADAVPFADVVYTSELMKRIEVSVTNLKSNINTEARMKEDPASVIRELHVLSAIAAMMSTDSYEYTREQAYQDFVVGFRDAGLQGVEAVKSQNFAAFQDSVNKIQNSCNPCHQKYRGAESGF